jgi:RNA polymerase sigma-54 factor
MEPRLVQTQRQQLVLTQKMQQAIQILQLSGMELEQYVQQELETNPVLEVLQHEPEQERQRDDAPPKDERKEEFEGDFNLDDYADQWDMRRVEGRDLSINRDLADRRKYYEDSITKEESFTSRLLTQLRMATDSEEIYAIGERIVGDIDDRGYFTGDLPELAAEIGKPLELVEKVLRLIQRFEPTGVGARDVKECLLLQINVEYPEDDELRVLVRDHLEELERRQIPKIAKSMKITPERVEELKTLLSRLDPWPGHEYSTGPAQYVTPDVVVEKNDETGEYDVYLVDDRIPNLRISNQYRLMAKKREIEKEARQYVRDKVESARWLIRNIEQRQRTILRVANSIVEVQREFLDKGVEFIRPLTLQEIADKVGVHEATVSRTTRGKYMQTPQGLFELKYFFSPGLRTDDGDSQSSKSVQSLIKVIIEKEDKRKPLSDQKIADLLKDQGINIARRTVTKYREALDILPTSMRKEY